MLPAHLTPVTTTLLVAHIAAGFIALLVAPGAMLTRKGARWHRRWGRVYFWAMAVVAATALPVSVLRPSPFLFMVAIFSFYLAFAGYRVLRRKRPERGDRASWPDWAAVALVAAGSAGLAGWGVVAIVRGASFGAVAVVFGVTGGILARRDVRAFRRPPTDPMAWRYAHMGNFLGAYIATVTAFSAVNLHALPPLVRWLWPTLVGVPALSAWIRRERQARVARPVGGGAIVGPAAV